LAVALRPARAPVRCHFRDRGGLPAAAARCPRRAALRAACSRRTAGQPPGQVTRRESTWSADYGGRLLPKWAGPTTRALPVADGSRRAPRGYGRLTGRYPSTRSPPSSSERLYVIRPPY